MADDAGILSENIQCPGSIKGEGQRAQPGLNGQTAISGITGQDIARKGGYHTVAPDSAHTVSVGVCDEDIPVPIHSKTGRVTEARHSLPALRRR
jgi:hypothetical protein